MSEALKLNAFSSFSLRREKKASGFVTSTMLTRKTSCISILHLVRCCCQNWWKGLLLSVSQSYSKAILKFASV